MIRLNPIVKKKGGSTHPNFLHWDGCNAGSLAKKTRSELSACTGHSRHSPYNYRFIGVYNKHVMEQKVGRIMRGYCWDCLNRDNTIWVEPARPEFGQMFNTITKILAQRYWTDLTSQTGEVSHRGNKNLEICQIDASENSTPAMCRSDKLKSDSRDGAIVSICRIVETRQCQLVDLTNWKVPIWQIESFNFPNWKKSIWQIYTFQVSNLSNCKP